MKKSTAIIAKWHNHRLQQMRTSPNAAATDTKEEKPLTWGRPPVSRDLQQDTLAPAANPYMRSGKGWILAPALPDIQEHCMHLSSPGSALPSYQVLNPWFKP